MSISEKNQFPEFGDDLLSGEGRMKVPKNYNWKTFIDEFAKKTRDLDLTHYYNPNLTSENFKKVTDKFIPDKIYGVKVIPLLQDGILSKRILEYMTANNFLKVGAHGALLLQETNPEYFTKDKWHLSFDEKKALPVISGDHRVPRLHPYSDGDWKFYLGFFEGPWYSGQVLICFYELEEGQK